MPVPDFQSFMLPLLKMTADGHRKRFGGGDDVKQRLQSAIGQIVPVRNEIAHVREVEQDRLLKASVACADVLAMLRRDS